MEHGSTVVEDGGGLEDEGLHGGGPEGRGLDGGVIVFPPEVQAAIDQVSIYKFGLSVCLSVCIQLTSKRLNRSGPNFLWDI